MSRRSSLTLIALTLLVGCGSASSAEPPVPHPTATSARTAVRSSGALAVDLLRRVGGPGTNAVFSPYSIQAAVAMVDAGARGETVRQIDKLLGTGSAAPLASGRAAATGPPGGGGASARNAAQLRIANSLWLQSGFSVAQPFTRTLARDFAASAQQLDFQSKPEPARAAVNDWVARRTAGRIKDLMPPGSITSETKLVLANAVYLKAHWETLFNPQATGPAPFFTGTGTKLSAKFMGLPATQLRFAKTRAYQAVELPYDHSSLAMLVVMPPRGALPRFQQLLKAESISAVEASLRSGKLRLQMPKFHLRIHTDLVAALSALGMPVAFSGGADFSGITAHVPLRIGTVQHGADLAVDEQGTIAAAATGVSIVATAVAPLPATNIKVDHPFLLFLRDRATGAVLFAGRVADPTGS